MPKPSTGPGRTTRSGQSTATKPLGPRPQRVPSTAKSPARRTLERYSEKPLIRLHRLPRLLVPILMAAFLLAGLLIPNPLAGLFLLVLSAFLGWLTAVSWPTLVSSARVIRVAVTLVIFAAAIWRFTGNG